MAYVRSENEEWLSVLQSCSFMAIPMAIQASCELGIFEILQNSNPTLLSAKEIAQQIPNITNPDAPLLLETLLNLLSSFTPLLSSSSSSSSSYSSSSISSEPAKYSLLSPAKFFLKDSHGISLGSWALSTTISLWGTYKHLPSVIREGGNGFHRAFGHDISHHVAHHAPQMAPVMAAMNELFMKQFLQIYDGFASILSLVDVGGGDGSTLRHILGKYPHLHGINLDQPQMLSHAVAHPRMKHVGGNMLESIPSADAALLKLILHDWEEDECLKILSNCKQAISGSKGKVIVVEFRLADSDNDPIQLPNFLKMASHGSKIRGIDEYKKLGRGAGFADVKVACIVNEYIVLELSL